ASSTNPASGPATTSSPCPRRVTAPTSSPPATTERAIAAIRVASSQVSPPNVDRPTLTAVAMSARPSVTLVRRERGRVGAAGAGATPGSGRSQANGAAPRGSHEGGTGGPNGASGPEPGSWDAPGARQGPVPVAARVS